MKEFWRRNQSLLLYAPACLLLLAVCYMVLKALDPRIGVEGFGDLFGYLLNALRVAMIVFTAWWLKRNLFFDLHQSTELSLHDRAREGDWPVFWLVMRDRAEWVVLLALATYWFTR